MRSRHRPSGTAPLLAALVLVSTAALGCGEPPQPTPDAGPADPCTQLAPGSWDLQFNGWGQFTGVRFPLTPNLGEDVTDWLRVEFYDSSTPNLPELAEGTFTLGAAPDDNLATCQHCVWLPVDWDDQSPFGTLFVATEGDLTLSRIEDPLPASIAGHLTGLVLREATLDEQGQSALTDGGRCLRLPGLEFDTAPTPGRSCLSAEDCGNPLIEVCSPATYTCAPLECGEFMWCDDARPLCLSQDPRQEMYGACYATCLADQANSCPSGEVCVKLGLDPSYGFCLRSGDGQVGAPCSHADTSTECAPELRCSSAALTCTRTCDFYAAAPGCQEGSQCGLFGLCEPPTTAVAVELGASCGEQAELAQGCAADGQAYRGICFAYQPTETLICERACLGERGCGSGEFCALRFSSGLGICRPLPVCGDGVFGEINEVCDDGNLSSGDGCSADCQVVEYEPLCAAATALTAGTPVAGDTQVAVDGFQASCQTGIARAEIYRYTPPGRGRLRLVLESATAQIVSLRSDCATSASEVACGGTGGLLSAFTLTHQITDPAIPITVLVSAGTVLDEGPFTLHVEFTPEQCGDGIVAGRELCDDGNATGDDGCSADCSEIEYAALCTLAPPLSVTEPNVGTTEGGLPYFEASCSNTVLGSGPERLYRYVAPTAGTLELVLAPADILLALSVFEDCATSGTLNELDCSPSFLDGRLALTLAAGQAILVLVEAYAARDLGPYSLTATFTP